ncbi:MAG: DUF2156 domain-containing protein [Ruminococcus sp.]|nr:DUF2156 domain-containing protein [Ruminococcus sp.]
MLEFRDIDISDKDRINKALRYSDLRGCEYSFANNMAWRRLADSKIAFYKDFYLCTAFMGGQPRFILPSGSGDYREVITEMKCFSEAMGYPLIISNVTHEGLAMLSELFPDSFTFSPDRDGWDYIYSSSDLITLKGRKYHGKRNHLAAFAGSGAEFSVMTEKDFDDCITFGAVTYNSKAALSDHSMIAEQFAINTYFNYFHELELKGGVVRKDGKVCAFTIGEGLNSDTFCVHIEKADTQTNGIYAGINNCFAKAAAADYKYINREEDMGIDGLRRSKLSYHPAFLLEKHEVIFK